MGWEWLPAIGFLFAIFIFYIIVMLPLNRELSDTKRHASMMQHNFKQIQRAHLEALNQTPSGQLDQFYAYFPNESSATDITENLIDVATNSGLFVSQAQYKLVTTNPGKLLSYQLSLPIKGSYSNILKFIFDALSQIHNLSLDAIQLQRQKVGDSDIDATLVFTLYLRRES
jgi:hypothetical protein